MNPETYHDGSDGKVIVWLMIGIAACLVAFGLGIGWLLWG